MHANVQSVHAATQTREECAVRGMVSHTTAQNCDTKRKKRNGLPHARKERSERLSSDVLVLRALETNVVTY